LKKIALIGMLFVIAALGLAACTSDDEGLKDVRLALDWFPNANHAGLFLALEKGYFEEEGLNVTTYTPVDPSSILQTVGTGADEFGINYQPDLLLARAEGVPVVSVAGIVQRPLNSVMTLKSSGIIRPRDLVGKKVGYPGIPTNEPLLDTMLKYDGTRGLEDVELVNVGFNLGAALISGQVDACVGCYWTHESISMENEGHPVNIMRMEEWGVPSYYELVLVTSENQLAKDPETVQAFIRAFLRGYREAAQDTQMAIDALVKAHPETDQAIDRPGIELIMPLWQVDAPVVGWQDQDRWVEFTRWMQDNGLLDKSVDPMDSFTNQFVEDGQ
jgi:putative hydroxymethylpyrimidine transport system substrate-binding protein